jgi:hypothetical protein
MAMFFIMPFLIPFMELITNLKSNINSLKFQVWHLPMHRHYLNY